MKKARIIGNYHLVRAIEVARRGRHSLIGIGKEANIPEDLKKFCHVYPPCPCGNLGEPKLICSCSAEEIQKWFRYELGELLRVPAICVKFTTPASKNYYDGGTIIDDIPNEKVDDDSKPKAMDEQSQKLLDTVIDRLVLPVRFVEFTISVAGTIAVIEKSTEIRLSDIAEALQYLSHGVVFDCEK